MAAPKIAKYSLSELKNTTDDTLQNYLTSLNFKQIHFLTDVRLALGYAAVSIAAVLFYLDWKLGWDATKAATLWAVIAYFTINGALTLWIWGVEKGKVFSGEKDGTLVLLHALAKEEKWVSMLIYRQLSIASSVTKYTPIYNITVRQQTPTGKEESMKLSAPFTRWFDADGCFVAKPFQHWLATEVPVIGEADPNNKQTREANGGIQVAEAVDIEQSEKSGKADSREVTPASTRSKRGRK
ncbi:MAG: hypothetical protein Q9217_001667 [Psora testacea]